MLIRPILCRFALGCLLAGLPAGTSRAEGPAEAEPPGFDDAAIELFEKQIRPLLVARCYECHSAQSKEPKGGLRVDSRTALLTGGDTGPAVVPGDSQASLLIDAVNYGDLYQMPPKSKLPAGEIALLTKWVSMGAPWPREDGPAAAQAVKPFDLNQRRAEHWAWAKVKPQPAPPVRAADWPQSPIDRFILARLEAEGLEPAAPADRRTLARRLYFDLVGLPPSPEEMETFLADSSPRAFERLVDRLLGSVHFGERWARHWLDLVRYAETRGHEFEPVIPNAWQYRDYVIRALNADVPYDQLVQEHIAGDLLDPPRLHPEKGFNESILGTGFWFLGEEVHSPVDVRQDECDRLDNRIDVMTKTFLGLTVSCARCHDHKFDAISQRDYYALAGYLVSSSYRQVRFETLEHDRRIARQLDELRASAGRELLALTIAAQRDTLDRLADYWLAAGELLSAGVDGAAIDPQDGRAPPQIAELAGERKLDAELLRRWAAELVDAGEEPVHPLHVFAVVAGQADGKMPDRFAALLQPWRERGAALAAEPADDGSATRSAGEIVVDYRSGDTTHWYQDGFAFGLRPIRPGDVKLGTTAERPVLGLFDEGFARRDPFWNDLRPADGTQRDHAKLGEWDRPGRTLRTPEATLTAPRLWYLVRGRGRAYASIHSHLIVAGPLHGNVLLELGGDAERWRWVAHDLRRYQGQRFHVEFTPRDGDDLEIALVVQSEAAPPLPKQQPNALLLTRIAQAEIDSPARLAHAYQRLLLEASELAAADKLPRDGSGRDAIRLAGWLLENCDLFISGESEARRQLHAAAEKFLSKEAELKQQVRFESQAAPAMLDGNGVDEVFLVRGNPRTPGPAVPRRFLEALGGQHQSEPGSGRLQLARRIADPANPLTARVMANRVWHHLFGRGLVASVDNFGVLGQPPSHPELLDYLAAQLVEEGWSVKRLIRSIVLTRTYQMSSTLGGPGDALDPDNVLLHRAPIRRLQGEAIRDAMLAISGRLERRPLGPSVPVYLTPFLDGRGKPGSGPLDGGGRRSIYISVRRNFLSPMMLAFDTPQPFSTMGRRNVSNVPAQALILMNDPLVIEQARLWAQKVLAEGERSPEERITGIYQSSLARPPSEAELASALAFLDEQGQRHGLPPERRLQSPEPWTDLCHVMFNLKEFIFIE